MKSRMANRSAFLLAAAWFAGSALAQQITSPVTTAQQVTAEDLAAQPVGENWTSYNGDYTGRRYSSLKFINASNVAQLKAAWVFHPGNTQALEVTPVGIRGLMFI